MALNTTENQSLYTVRDLIAPIANINFFIKLDSSDVTYSDDALAGIIKADNYSKTKQKVAEFTARQQERLDRYKKTALEKEADFEEAVRQAKRSEPGPKFLVNRESQEAVSRYNNQLDLYRRLTDKAEAAKDRYENALEKFKQEQADVEEKIRGEIEKLKPALDKDMVAFLGKLQQLVYDCFHNKALIFESFILLFMAKKAYMFLYDRIENTSDRTTASNTFRQLNSELETLVEKHSDNLKHGFTEIVTYMYDCFQENEAIFATMQQQLEQLPYEVCRTNDDFAHSLTSLVINTNFPYKDVIDPVELARVESRIREHQKQYEKSIAEIDMFTNQHTRTFDDISKTLADSKAKLQLIRQNKETRLGEAFDYSRFVLGVFYEEVQDEYLKQQKVLLEAMQLEIETSLGINLTKLIKTILETELLSVSAAQAIDTNAVFAFLEYRQKLQKKRRELTGSIDTLNRQLQNISQQPKEKAEEFSQQMQTLLGISVLPVGNLGTLFPLHQAITKFLPALGSGHPIYAETREITKGKLQGFLIAHAVIAVLFSCGALATKDGQQSFVLGVAGTYGVSAGVLFLKKKQLTDL